VPKLVVNPSSPNRREISLSPATALTIGRDPTNDVVLPDAMVSRHHAVVEPRAGLFVLRDCHSANGSVVNGERVSERGLRDGDVVAIGTVRLVYHADPPDSPSGKVVLHPSAVPLRCQACGAEYRRGDVFCRECGKQVAPLSGQPKAVCVACGAAITLPARYCASCGEALAGGGDAEVGSERDPREAWGGSARWQGSLAIASERPARDLLSTIPPRDELLPAPDPHVPGPDAVAAEPGSRLAAALIDAVFIASGQLALLAPVFWYWWDREVPRSAADVPFLPVLASVTLVPLALLLGALYHVYFWTTKGATPGKELLDLQVRCDDGSPITIGRAILRVLGYALGVASLGVGFLMVAFGGCGLQDRVAHTRVVKVTRR
jgi:uncharacterized RDD family membrane protein YckC